ncbi:MAG: type II secretion system F family protein [Candidatus Liberibacter ctenarytainae]|uniref:Type II secretion system F family protein n=1 Tax=Candidatus Liberibacter ctenarytainae TaxID=2020335 RepID=A0A937AKW7_9HYPH|nr:type II secretion system F family protein [Candidatus Liberibacter ctenarytainae]
MELDFSVFLVMVLTVVTVFFLIYAIFFNRGSADDERISKSVLESNKQKESPAASKRRKAMREAMQKIEQNNKKKSGVSTDIASLLSYSGLPLSKKFFYIISSIFGCIFFIGSLVATHSLYFALCASVSAILMVPRLILKRIIKNRQAKFLDDFPNALDIIIRSVRSGLPSSDAMAIIVNQSIDPIRMEFRRVIEAQHLGLSVSESVSRMVLYMPLQEVSFFSTVISIQAQSGGNLSEALTNLSRVLRERKKMKAKVQALSMEAKSSAWIIGSLPFIVSSLVYLTSPDYMKILFIDPRGHMILGIGAFSMFLGVMVMRSMINFDV